MLLLHLVPAAEDLVHRQQADVGKIGLVFGGDRRVSSPQVEYWKARHRALFVRRNFGGWTRLGALGYLVLTKPGRALAEALRGRPGLGWAVLRGTLAGLLSKHGQRVAGQPAAVQHSPDGVLVYE